MFSYINYNTLNALLAMMVIFNLVALRVPAAASEAVNKIKNTTATLYFTYSGEEKKYKHFVIDGSLIAGKKARIVYGNERKEILFNNNCSVYMRYSYDFWQSCSDVELKPTVTGELSAVIKIPDNASTVQVAFFAAYPYDNYKSWGFIWDSNYGKNFTVKLITKKELEDKKKFDALNAI